MRPGMPSAKGTSLGRPSPAMDQKVLLGRQVTARSHSSEATAEAVAVYISLNKTQKMLKWRREDSIQQVRVHLVQWPLGDAMLSRVCKNEKKKKEKRRGKKESSNLNRLPLTQYLCSTHWDPFGFLFHSPWGECCLESLLKENDACRVQSN